jgi:hypothetical protein
VETGQLKGVFSVFLCSIKYAAFNEFEEF